MGKTKHSGPIKMNHKPKPSLWASPIPLGLGKTKNNHYRDMLKVVWENKDNLGYAWRILNEGVCDGCALGVSGLNDQTLQGPHLCMTRLNLLRLNTMPAMGAPGTVVSMVTEREERVLIQFSKKLGIPLQRKVVIKGQIMDYKPVGTR